LGIEAAQRIAGTREGEFHPILSTDVFGGDACIRAAEPVSEVNNSGEDSPIVGGDGSHAGSASIKSSTLLPDGMIGQTFSCG
jgi:hypothetical protein